MKHYKEFIISSEPFIPELLSGILWELDINGIDEEVNCLRVFTLEESNVSVESISALLQKLKDEKMLFNFLVEEHLLRDKNWNREWEKKTKTIKASNKFVIKPSFRKYNPKEGEIVITIDPKMSFGTGEHASTKLVLREMEKYISNGPRVLDVGSGTGVLAIAAIKLGAESAIALDNNDWCYENAKENTVLNDVSGKVDVRIGEIEIVKENDFDVILANIQKNVLLEIAGEIKNRLRKEGVVILSGILYNDEEVINEKYTSLGFKLLSKQKLEDWIALSYKIKN